MKLHHIGIVTENIERDITAYERLGYMKADKVIIDEIQKNRLMFIRNSISGEMIELIEPMDGQSSVATAKKGLTHLCYEVSSLTDKLDEIKREHLGVIFTDILTAPALGNGKITFVYYKGGAVMEFFEPKAAL